MAYGTPASPDDDRGRTTPTSAGVARPPRSSSPTCTARYDAIGGISPLAAAHRGPAGRASAAALEARRARPLRGALGQKHAAPFIEDGVAELADAGVDRGRRRRARPALLGLQRAASTTTVPPRRRGPALRLRRHRALAPRCPSYVDFLADAVRERRADAARRRTRCSSPPTPCPSGCWPRRPVPRRAPRRRPPPWPSGSGCSPWPRLGPRLAERRADPRAVARPRHPRGHPRPGGHRPGRRRPRVPPGLHRRPPRGALRPRHRGRGGGRRGRPGVRPHPVVERRPRRDGGARRPRRRHRDRRRGP